MKVLKVCFSFVSFFCWMLLWILVFSTLLLLFALSYIWIFLANIVYEYVVFFYIYFSLFLLSCCWLLLLKITYNFPMLKEAFKLKFSIQCQKDKFLCIIIFILLCICRQVFWRGCCWMILLLNHLIDLSWISIEAFNIPPWKQTNEHSFSP